MDNNTNRSLTDNDLHCEGCSKKEVAAVIGIGIGIMVFIALLLTLCLNLEPQTSVANDSTSTTYLATEMTKRVLMK